MFTLPLIGQGHPKVIIYKHIVVLYMTSFVEIDPSVPEKKIFGGFLPYTGVAAILVMSCDLNYL